MKKLYAFLDNISESRGFFFRRNVNSIKKINKSVKKDGKVKKPKFGVIAKNKTIRRTNFIAIAVIIVAYVLLFVWMRDKLLFTPDFGESDAYHLNLSFKYYLSSALKKNSVPFWTNALEGGYPLFSEAQIGALFLPNIFFLRFFSFVDGYNLLFISSLFISTLGLYLLLTELGISGILSLIYGFIFTFNGSLSLRFVHLNLLQSFSLLPFLFYLTIRFYKTDSFRYFIFFVLTLSQMIFAGHMQTVYTGIFGLVLWYIGFVYSDTKIWIVRMKKLVQLSLLIVSSMIVSLPQILPTYLLAQNSSRSVFLDYSNATSFPFSWSNLVSFVNPFTFGNPKLGTYPPFSSNWGIFWENTPYLGGVFFMLFIILFFLNRKSLSSLVALTISIGFFFILLALGKNSPLYFVFNFPPFNFFRTPSKYLLMTNFFFIVGGALLAEQWLKKNKSNALKIVFIFFSIFIIIDLFKFTFDYHLFLPSKSVMKPIGLSSYFDSSISYMTFGQEQKWNELFLKNGWKGVNEIDTYLFMRNFLYPNSNLLVGKKVYDLNTGTFRLRRPDFVKNLIQHFDDPATYDLMHILGIGIVISALPIDNQDMKLVKKISRNDSTIYIYTLLRVRNEFFYAPKILKRIEYLNDFVDKFKKNDLSADNSVIENVDFNTLQNNLDYSLKLVKQSEYRSDFIGRFASNTVVAFRQNIYPEWSVSIDGKRAPAYPVNLVHIGVIIPKGDHTIVLEYKNRYFTIGVTISFIFAVGCVMFGLYRLKRS